MPTPAPHRRLRVGDIVRHAGQVWRVDLVNSCRARLRPLTTRHARFKTYDDRDVDFVAPGHTINICPDSDVERVDPSTLTEEAMSTKKTTKTKTPRAPKQTEELCVFALRMTPAEREALHKTAGPRGATQFARAVLNAAAGKDLDAFKAAVKAVEA